MFVNGDNFPSEWGLRDERNRTARPYQWNLLLRRKHLANVQCSKDKAKALARVVANKLDESENHASKTREMSS
jgi:hypothetical protein